MKPWPSELSIAGSDTQACFSISSQRGGTTSSQVSFLTCFTTLGLSLHILLLKKTPVSLYFLRISLAVEILILRVFATFAMGSPYFSTFSTKFCLLYVSKCLPSSIFWYTFYGMSHNLSISSSQSINLLLLIAQTLPLQDYSYSAKRLQSLSLPAPDAEAPCCQRQLPL